MRLTNNMMSRNYLKNLNSSLKELNDANTRITAKRSYMRISEDPATALKAMKIRKNLSRLELYMENLSNAQGILDQYESTISKINSLVTEALAQVAQGITGTSDSSARLTVANTLRGFQESILAASNTRYADDFIFGGSNVGEKPFAIGASGELLYNGQDVNTGIFSDENIYIDIGIGLDVNEFGFVDPKSAFNIAIPGTKLLGTGLDENGLPNNLYNLLGEIADKLANNDLSNIELYAEKLEDLSGEIRMQYVGIGEKSNFITYFKERLDSEKLNSKTKQSELEGMQLEQGIIEFGEMELAYNACLQMGAKILQPSLLDFLR